MYNTLHAEGKRCTLHTRLLFFTFAPCHASGNVPEIRYDILNYVQSGDFMKHHH